MADGSGLPTDWFWEGDIQRRIVEYLESADWGMAHVADTGRHEHGPDIDARQLGRRLLVDDEQPPLRRLRELLGLVPRLAVGIPPSPRDARIRPAAIIASSHTPG